ncbi:canalicular multispecific organic anion transporter 1, partial [Plakobranchus ocellatus]
QEKEQNLPEFSPQSNGVDMTDLSSSYTSSHPYDDHETAPLLGADMNGKVREGRSNGYSKPNVKTPKPEEKSKPSLLKVLVKLMSPRLIVGLVQKIISDVFLLCSPVLLSLLISYADNRADDYAWKGFAIAVLLFLSQMFKSVLFNLSFWASQIAGMQMKTILIAAIYKKALTMNNEAKKESTAGEIVNLMSVDCQRIMEVMNFFFFAWTTPLQIIAAIAILYQYIGVSALAGLAVLLMTVPLNSYLAGRQQKLQLENLKLKDSRLRLTNEALAGMKVLKLYAWEPAFQQKISDIRDEETRVLLSIAYLNAMISVCYNIAPYLVMLATFAVYVNMSEENHLDANKAFVSLSFFNLLKVPLSLLSTIISMSVQAIVSVGRINTFLCTGDLNRDNIKRDSRAAFAVEIENGTFTWNKETSPSLTNINLRVPEGKLYAVVGPVGSGKSSLMAALLGEMERLVGRAVIKSKVAYVPQQAWIQNATLRDNILFGKPYNKRKYKKVLSACALERDLEILSAGDMTEIGEKGINLSGGQKQRVSLARAVYSNADIFILDDPLSAVDAHVGKHIFTHVVGEKGLLRGKTRVLVTHGAHWLPMVDSIVVLENGHITETGSYEDLMAQNGAFADFIRTYLLSGDDEANSDDQDPEITAIRSKMRSDAESALSDFATSGDEMGKPVVRRQLSGHRKDKERAYHRRGSESRSQKMSLGYRSSITASGVHDSQTVVYDEWPSDEKMAGRLVQDEKMEKGKVKLAVFWTYSKAMGQITMGIAFVLFALFQVFSAWSNFWLNSWTEDPYLANTSLAGSGGYKQKNDYYLGIFGLFGIIQIIFLVIHNIIYWIRMVVAAKRLHSGMLASIFHSPMSFFDTTPLGRVMNRFSRDIEVVDNMLPLIVRDYVTTMFACLVTLIIICISSPLFLSLIIPILIIFLFIQNFYIPTSRQLKRIESVTRSPVYIHFSETISGGPTIRAYDTTLRFMRESKSRVDRNQSFYYISLAANRWLGMNLEILANIVILGSAVFAVLTPGISGGEVGLSVSYAIQVSSNLTWMVRQMSDLETNIVSVERLKEYSELESESAWIFPHHRPVPDWPQEGMVKFSNYQTRYRSGLELVLKGITCDFMPGEKVGIVGRTGAGKSSLALALFRLIEASSGSITVDSINLGEIGLHDVRSRLTILPQDPVLFFGSLRMNLDPLNVYTDGQLWAALTRAHLREFVNSLSEGLDYPVGEEGQSLSVGQRQLVCLARALLKKTQILILDEATAAVDMETDTLIQNTIRSEFERCTIITIAHRLNTIMDYDRIMVLDAGLIKEFDSPANLLADSQSVFYSMAKEANLV